MPLNSNPFQNSWASLSISHVPQRWVNSTLVEDYFQLHISGWRTVCVVVKQQCVSLVCFNSVWNNAALWHRGRRDIRLWIHRQKDQFIDGFALFTGSVDNKKRTSGTIQIKPTWFLFLLYLQPRPLNLSFYPVFVLAVNSLCSLEMCSSLRQRATTIC